LYAECTEYTDVGALKRSDKLDPAFGEFTLEFSTRFKRNKTFRFKWTDLGDTNQIIDDKRGARVILHGKQKKATDLNEAFAKASGITGGATHNIPSLLFDGMRGRSLRHLTDLSIEDDEELEQRTCLKLCGKLIFVKDTIIWIDATNFQILRIETHTSQSGDEVRKGREIASSILTDMGESKAAQYLLSAAARPSQQAVVCDYSKITIAGPKCAAAT
jgi:hypothetical protein